MDPTPPSRIGGHLLDGSEGMARRSLLLLGGLGATSVLGVRIATDAGRTAHAAAPPAPPTRGLPTPPPPPAFGDKPREPWSSGALGPWHKAQHLTSHPDEDLQAATHDGIHLVGDSIATRLLPALRQQLAGRPLSFDLWNSRPTAPGLDSVARLADADRLAPTVLVVLGSNDIFNPWGFEDQVRRCRQIVGERRLLWVTPYVSRPSAPAADLRNSALLGLVLERVAATGGIELVRWFELLARMAENLDDYIDDGVHPTPAGASALAELIGVVLG